MDYAKFGVSNLVISNVIEEKHLGSVRTPPPFGKGRVKAYFLTI